MAELPKSWGLETKVNDRGTLDVMGKTDAGETYKVRTTDHAEITDHDISELRDADRESYQGTTSDAAWDYVHKLTDYAQAQKSAREASFQDDLNSAAEDLVGETKVRRGFVSRSDTIVLPEFYGYSHIPEWRWNMAFNKTVPIDIRKKEH